MTDYTRDQMEAALCLWEAMLEMRESMPDLGRAFMKYGTSEMRLASIDLGVDLAEEWDELMPDAKNDAGPFDWEYVPGYVKRVDWTQWPPAAPGSSTLSSQDRGTE